MIGDDNQKKIHKILTKILAGWLIVFLVVGGLVMFVPARAVGEQDAIDMALMGVSTALSFIPGVGDKPGFWQQVGNFADKVYRRTNAAYQKLADIGFKDAVRKMLNNMAKDTATFMVTGDKGKAPMFQTSFVKYIQKEGDAFLGDALNNQISKAWGVSLCEPLNPLVKVRVELTAKQILKEQKPSCTFTKMRKNLVSLKDAKLVDLPKVADMFNPSSNDLGTLLQVTTKIDEARKKDEEMKKMEQQITKGVKHVTSKITGDIKTPAWMVELMASQPLVASLQKDLTHTGTLAADIIGPFANTLGGQLFEKIKKGLLPEKAVGVGSGGAYSPTYGTAASIEQLAQAGIGEMKYNYGGMVDVLDKLSCDSENTLSCIIDPNFRSAIESEMTVEEALDQSYLHGDWPVGFRAGGKTDGGNEPASNNIYSYRNLLILRKYRIIPVGWELAAIYYSKYDQTGLPLTLKRLINEYNNEKSPYYRLVDKGWVLKAPETKCERQGAGEEIEEYITLNSYNENEQVDINEVTEAPVRKDYCADERSCIKESADGKACEAWGYCTKEKPIWRVSEGECEAVYNSCQTYTKSDGTTISYLQNTLMGRGECDEPTAIGCQEYCLSVEAQSNDWSCKLSKELNEDSPNYAGKRIYLNNKASSQECSANEAGCSSFVRMSTKLPKISNWIPNSSFENLSGGEIADFKPRDNDTDFVEFGGSGTLVAGRGGYVFEASSLNIMINTGAALGGRIFVFSLIHKDPALNVNFSGEGRVTKLSTEGSSDGYYKSVWKYDFLEKTNSGETTIEITMGADTIDDLQFLEANEAAGYSAYGEVNKINLKKAPEDYKCDLYAKVVDDVAEADCKSGTQVWRDDIQKCVEGGSNFCNDYALYCLAGDADCQFYEPTSYRGPKQPGVIGPNDLCPKECVGYKSYLEQPSFFEPLDKMPADRNPVRLIASSAKNCSASENGCEEFTNLSKGAEGERKEYYTNLRACVLPDAGNTNIKSYYSWASSDEAGNQLRSWTLLKSDTGNYPCTNPRTATDGTVTCHDGEDTPQLCTLGSTILADNPVYNPDCIEFIDTNNEAHWVKFSRVVFASDECTKLRRTYVPAGSSGSQEIYSGIPSLSQTCSAAAAGCREYKGSASNNINVVVENNFEDKTSQGWSGGENSNESIIASGHSLYASSGTITKDVKEIVNKGNSYKLSFWAKAKGTNATLVASFSGDPEFNTYKNTGVNLTKEWSQYILSLTNLERDVNTNETLQLQAGGGFYIDNIILTETDGDLYLIKDSWQTPAACDQPAVGAELGCEAYKDKDGKEWYAKSFSKICYDYAVGCEAMIDTQNSRITGTKEYNGSSVNDDPRDNVIVPADKLVYLVYDEDKTCSAVGCTRLGLMTMDQNMSKLIFETKHYIVNPDDFDSQTNPLCISAMVGCAEMEATIKNTTTKVRFKDPGNFICEYKGVSGYDNWYKVGSSEACPGVAWNEDVTQGYCSNEPNVKCTEDSECAGAPCIVERHCVGGRAKDPAAENNTCQSNNDCVDYSTGKNEGICSSWAAICPDDRTSCSEYQDPNTPEGCNRLLVNFVQDTTSNNRLVCDYYYYKADYVEDGNGCTGVDNKKGCLGFHKSDGGPDTFYSVSRCEDKPSIRCESDSDCLPLLGGRCVTQVQQGGSIEP